MSRKWLVFSGLALVLAVAAGVVALRAVRARSKAVAVAPAPLPAALPAGLVVLSGRIRAQETVDVPAGVVGSVDMFYADVGHEVAEGQLLAHLSSLGLETAREVANTALDNAQAVQAREQIAGLQEQVDLAKRILADRTQQVETATAAMAANEVISPVDGLVVGRRGEVGKPAEEQGDQLFQIAVNPSLLQVAVEPEPPVLARIRPGMEALVVVPEMQTDAIPATVKAIEKTVVLVDFTSPSPDIKPGLTAEVRLKLE